MKKALSFAVALGLVAGMASVASAAELTINGDARWRGVYKDNTQESDDNVYDRIQKMDQRYRFNANLKINDDVTINTRLVLRDSEFGNDNAAQDAKVDRANMVIKTLGGTWTIGRQDVSWGNKFLAWGESADRIKGIYKSGDITFGGFLQKDRENAVDPLLDNENGDGDKDTWAGIFIMKSGNTTFGVLPTYSTDDSENAKVTGKDSGYLIDPFITTKMGPATVMAELVYQGGDLNENSAGDAVWGGFAAVSVDLAPVTVKGLVAYWDGNEGQTGKRDCDNDFAPSVLIGTCNETAVIDFGETTVDATPTATTTTDDFTYLVGVGVDFKASDKLTVGGLVGYLMATDKGGYSATAAEESASLLEVDLTVKYALAQNCNYTFSAAYGMPDQFSAQDDDWVVLGNRIEVAW